MIRLISLCFLFFIGFNGYSQLQRKVQFGARVEYVTENGNSGCKVQQVARGTSVALQLQEKDLILKIGNSTFSSTDEFINEFLKYAPDQEVQLTVLRGKKELLRNR